MRKLIDFHSHILPGIDDGSKTAADSIAMLRMEAEQGIGRVVATPHFYPQHDDPERFLRRRMKAEEALRNEMRNHRDLPEISVGAEVYYYRGMSNSEIVSELTIDQKRCILIEMPMAPWTDAMYRELESLYEKRGLIPIIAHVDRYIGRFRTYGIPERLAELPVLVQANASFFLNRVTSGMALRMLKNEKIHLLGSDCHDLRNRPPRLGEAYKHIVKHSGEDILEYLDFYGSKVFGSMYEVVDHA